MKKTSLLSLLVLSIACERETLDPPQIKIDPESAELGRVANGEQHRFNFHIRNIGEETLKIDNVRLRADQNCAFRFIGPDVKELWAKRDAFISMIFAPESLGDYQVALVIPSNSETKPRLVVPICATAVSPEDLVQDTAGLAGTDTAGAGGPGEPQGAGCRPPPADQPDCPYPNMGLDTDTDTETTTDTP